MYGFSAKTILAAILCAAFMNSAVEVRALPPYQRSFEAHYGYRPNCTLCHERDSWDLNQYGKGFYKSGRTSAAFERLEELDPDEDGFPSGAELRARANAGSPRSTPRRPGDWLLKLPKIIPPRNHLRLLFPGSDGYTYREEVLGASARKRIEAETGGALGAEHAYPSFFAVFQEGKLVGAALYGSSAGSTPCAYLAGYTRPEPGRAMRLTGIHMLSCRHSALRRRGYTRQFNGRTPDELRSIRAPKPRYKAAADAVVDSVRVGAAVIREVFR